MEGEKSMKERIGIHFCITYIYLVFARNFLNNGLLYGTFHTSFQFSLVYCIAIAAAITILLEMWKMMLEVIKGYFYGYILFLCPIISIILSAYLGSPYYASIILYIAFYITKDSLLMLDFINMETVIGGMVLE